MHAAKILYTFLISRQEQLSLYKGGGILAGVPEEYGEEGSGTDIILHGGRAGEINRGLVYRALRRLWRRESFSIGAPLIIIGSPFTGYSEKY